MVLVDLFVGFARVGLLGFGGGPSMIPLMQTECIGAGWVNEEQFIEGLAAGNALPGPISSKMAVYVGFHEAGVAGAVAALIGVVLPSALLMGMLGALLVRHREHPYVMAALKGVKPAIVGMLFFVAWDLAPTGIVGLGGALLAVAAFAALVMRVHPGVVILASVVVGVLAFR